MGNIQKFIRIHNGVEYTNYRINKKVNGVFTNGEKKFIVNGFPKITITKGSYMYGQEVQFSLACEKKDILPMGRNFSNWNVLEINMPKELGLELIKAIEKDFIEK